VRKVALVSLVTIGVLLFACSRGGGTEIGEADNGSQVVLRVGQTMVLTLKSNPTTGYAWEIAEIDGAILKETYHEYKADWPVLLGSGGKDIWHFQAEAEGKTALTLNYRRSWEEAEPIQTFSVEVVVR
jgi:inhibitor of cysteine peptidase